MPPDPIGAWVDNALVPPGAGVPKTFGVPLAGAVSLVAFEWLVGEISGGTFWVAVRPGNTEATSTGVTEGVTVGGGLQAASSRRKLISITNLLRRIYYS